MTEKGMEAPLDDAIEQDQSVRPDEDADREQWPEELPLDADEADAAEQIRTVDIDEDDYR
ncbi:MAG TPA: hypothetical protein VLW50_15565 [Streptosporangiaceae bacterium]|nr:hypothetical protein [Streptosporangiaceae bacterium]